MHNSSQHQAGPEWSESPEDQPITTILFLCTGNSCRSQMAEGWARHFFDHKFTIYSAGIETHGLNPNAVLVMSESGIDISTQKSQHIDEFEEMSLDLIVTVCGHAHENCPVLFQESPVIHRGFPDPPKLAADESDAERKLGHYRDVRDMIKSYVETQLIVDLESAIK